MGTSASKSPFERRNTVARRSQRRAIHGLNARVNKIIQEIKKFRGTEENEQYKALLSELNHINNELVKKSRDLQPQVRNIHRITYENLQEAFRALEEKVYQNHDKARRKQEELEQKQTQKGQKAMKSSKETHDDDDDIEVIEENRELEESERLSEARERRQTVELKFVQVIPEATHQAEVHIESSSPRVKSPEEKRKSILKMGVPVMPGAMMGEITKKLQITPPRAQEELSNGNSNTLHERIDDIVEQLQEIECQIADFVGKKYGTQYDRIKDQLSSYSSEVSQMSTNDDFILDQIRACEKYIRSCMSFLDERAVDEKRVIEEERAVDHDEDVFLPANNNVISQVELNQKLQKLTRTTAI